jgi:integrase
MPKQRAKRRLPPGVYENGRSPFLWGRCVVGGREYRSSLRTADPEEAGLARARWKAEIEQQAQGSAETWKDAVVRWHREVLPHSVKPSVQRRYMVSIAMLDPIFGDLPLTQITPRRIADYVSSRSNLVSNATIRRDLTALSRLLSACCAWGWLDTNPAKAFDRSICAEPKRVFEPPTPEELQTLLFYAPAGMRAVLRFLNASGCRLHEATHLQRRAIDYDARTITLTDTKTTPRTIAFATFGGDVGPILAGAVVSLRSPYVFRTRDDAPYVQMSTGFQQVMGKAIYGESQAGRALRRFRIHDLRHGFAIRWLRAGGSIYDLKAHLGHTTVSTTEIYLRYLTRQEAELAKRHTESAHGETKRHTGTRKSQ